MSSLSRSVLDALYPEGSIWDVKAEGDLDLLLEALGENDDRVVDDIRVLCCIRDPFLTPLLSDLEREYGVATDLRLTEDERRNQLAAIIYMSENGGSKDDLQNALVDAGFPVQVHENSPAVDPDIFLNSIPFMVAGGDNAFAGFEPLGGPPTTAIAGKTGGDLLVNGAVFEQSADYLSVANGDNMFAGNGNALAGRFDALRQDEILYAIPDDPDSWPFFFFVGGDATRNAQGELTAIATVDIPIQNKTVFERIILRYKPIHSWAGLIINYT